MKGKIKNFFIFAKNAWLDGPRGKIGVILIIISLFFFVRLFFGTQNIQSFVVNAWHLNRDRTTLTTEQQKLKQIQHHIYLLKHCSTDYTEELGLKTLNLGNPEFKELKY